VGPQTQHAGLVGSIDHRNALWQLLPLFTFASRDLVITAVLDRMTGSGARVALAAIHNARRRGERDLSVSTSISSRATGQPQRRAASCD
jgi:hypothetical protein